MKEKLQKIREDAIRQIEASGDLSKLNDVRVAVLGKKGELTAVLKSMKDVSPEERPLVGQLVNEARAKIETRLEEKRAAFEKVRGSGVRCKTAQRSHRCDASGKEK